MTVWGNRCCDKVFDIDGKLCEVFDLKHLVIIGVGGFARECYWHAQGSIGYGEEWDIKGFLDGDVKLATEEYEKLEKPVLGNVASYDIQSDDVFICAIADCDVRKRLTDTVLERRGTFINLIHKTAIIQGNVKMGNGVIVGPFSHVNDHAEIGDFVILSTAGIGHDGKVGSYSSFLGNTSLCGFAVAGEFTYWATNAVALPHSRVEEHVYVGVNSVVFRHIKAGQRVFGNPAMPI